MMQTIEGGKARLDEIIRVQEAAPLGVIAERDDLSTTLGPFQHLPDYRTFYPPSVTEALGLLYAEYNDAFRPLVEANREAPTDYKYCIDPRTGQLTNYLVQIDMVGLPQDFLLDAQDADPRLIAQVLRGRVFEIENSLAMYPLILGIHGRDGLPSRFDSAFRRNLDELRSLHGRAIALLAVTEQKYGAMRETEFGKHPDEPLSNDEVRATSGFDTLLGPQEFLDHVRANGGRCDYLLYARTSEPVAKLRKPGLYVENPLLADPVLRGIIKANAITFNVDDPSVGNDAPQRINDTKEYMGVMGMGHIIHGPEDFLAGDLVKHLNGGRAYDDFAGERLAPGLAAFLAERGVDPYTVEAGAVRMRAKPMRASYGCYGHLSGSMNDAAFRHELRKSMRTRGPYVLQPEMSNPTIRNETDGAEYMYIDRNFMACIGGRMEFIGGHRALMPLTSTEAQNNRVHGSNATVWAEVSSE